MPEEPPVYPEPSQRSSGGGAGAGAEVMRFVLSLSGKAARRISQTKGAVWAGGGSMLGVGGRVLVSTALTVTGLIGLGYLLMSSGVHGAGMEVGGAGGL